MPRLRAWLKMPRTVLFPRCSTRLLAGPIAIMAYKAVNTLDSTFGYKNPTYREFGWFSARLDDLANFIPARLTGILIPVAALFLNLNAVQVLSDIRA